MLVHPAEVTQFKIDRETAEVLCPREGGDVGTGSGDGHFIAPVAGAVLVAAIGANFQCIGGLRIESG